MTIAADICAAFRELGIEGIVSKEGDFGDGTSPDRSGVVEIRQGPIRWVRVNHDPGPAYGELAGDSYSISCRVPDLRIRSGFPAQHLRGERANGHRVQVSILSGQWSIDDFAGPFYRPERAWTKPSDLRSLWSGCQAIASDPLATPIPQPEPTEADEVRAALEELGVEAFPATDDPFTTINVADGPIGEVGIGIHQVDGYITFTVPDTRMERLDGDCEIRSVRIRSFPVIGGVKEVRWVLLPDSDCCNSSVTDLLSENRAAANAVIRSGRDVKVCFGPSYDGWVLTPDLHNDQEDFSTTVWKGASTLSLQWDCYEELAEALLALPLSFNS